MESDKKSASKSNVPDKPQDSAKRNSSKDLRKDAKSRDEEMMKSVYVCENKLVELDDRLKKLFKGLRDGMNVKKKSD